MSFRVYSKNEGVLSIDVEKAYLEVHTFEQAELIQQHYVSPVPGGYRTRTRKGEPPKVVTCDDETVVLYVAPTEEEADQLRSILNERRQLIHGI